MDLLDGKVVAAIVGVVLFIAAGGFLVVMKPGGGKWRLLLRCVTIVTVQFFVLIAAISLINYKFAFFRTPAEIAAFIDSDAGRKVQKVVTEQLPTDAPTVDPRYQLQWEESSDEGMKSAILNGPESAIRGEMRAWVPRGYPEKNTDYNVIVLLPGTPGNARAIGPAIGAPEAIQEAIDAGTIPPTILITSDMNFGGRSATCADLAGGYKAETWFTKDLPAAIRTNFQVTRDPTGWAVVGPSMGAYCAARLGILHPQVYGNAVWLHGIDRPLEASFPDDPAVVDAQRLSVLASQVEQTANLMLVSSLEDPGTIDSARAIVSAVPDPSRVFNDERATGGHGWVVWIEEFPDVLEWLSTNNQKDGG